MIKTSFSLFSRLYLSTVVVIIASVALAKFVLDIYYAQEEIKYFIRDTHYIITTIALDNKKNKVNSSDQIISLTPPYNNEFTAKIIELSNNEKVCHSCQFIISSKNIDYYELSDERIIAAYILPNKNSAIIIADILESYGEDNLIYINEMGYYLIVIIASLFIGGAIYLPINNLQIQIKKLTLAHQNFGKGNMNVKADENLSQPLDELASSFNKMAQAIEENVQEKITFSQAIPHEIRTPLSRIQLASDIIRSKSDNNDISDLAKNIEDYVIDINQLIRQMVDYSRLSNDKSIDNVDPEQSIKLADFVNSRLALLTGELHKNSNKLVSIDIKNTIKITATPIYLRLVIDNFIKNAFNHAISRINISARYKSGQLLFIVEDDGLGIVPEKRATVFIPFARLDESRSRKTGGLGLGLPIAKAASRKINGNITISDSPLGGALFCLTVNVHQNEKSCSSSPPT
jgi:signal transduction histidine kinase